MDKYIKLDTVKKTLCNFIYEFDASRANPDFVRGIAFAREGLDRVPLEDVTPMMHGRWLHKDNGEVRCSNCNAFVGSWSKSIRNSGRCFYCYNCGAKMDGDKNE